MIEYRNFSCIKLTSIRRTDRFLLQQGSATSQNIDFSYILHPDFRKISLRSKTLSENLQNHGNFNWSKILRVPQFQVGVSLERLYIYSEFKAVHNALYAHRIDDETDQGLCFEGHSAKYYLLKQARFQTIRDEVCINVDIDLGNDASRSRIIMQYLAYFPFLRSFTNFVNSLGLQSVFIPEFERQLSYIMEDYYSKRSLEEPVNKNNDFNEEKNNLVGAIKGEVNSKGRVKLVNVRNDETKAILEENNMPLTNAFCTKNTEELFYMPVNGNFEVLNNKSFFFALANDIVISDKSDLTMLSRDYYKTMKLSKSQDFFVASEVFTNTNVKCKYIGSLSSEEEANFNTPFGFKNVTEFIEKLDDKVKKAISISEMVIEFLDEIEIEDPKGKS